MTIQMEEAEDGRVHTGSDDPSGTFEFPLVRRGYDQSAVQAYVAASSVELRHLAGSNRELLHRIGDLETRLAAAEAAAHAAAQAATRAAAPPPAPVAPPRPDVAAPAVEAAASGGRLPLFAVNRSAATARPPRAALVPASARAGAEPRVAAARARAAEITRQAEAQVASKRNALVGGLDVLQHAIARALDELDPAGDPS